MIHLVITPEETERFKTQMKKFSEKKTKKFRQATELAVTSIVAEAKRNAPEFQGRLRGSIKPIMSVNKLSGRAWTDVEYAAHAEFGTKSLAKIPPEIAQYAAQFKNVGNDGSFDDLLDQIRLWCKRKGIPEEAAYPIASKLVNKGRKAQPYLYPAFLKYRQKYIEKIKSIMNEAET